MIDKNEILEKVNILDDLAMKYEVAVIPLFEEDYLKEFLDFYEIKNLDLKLVPSEDDLDEALKNLSGEYRWEEIAEKTKSLFGVPDRIMVLEDDRSLKEELEGPDGLAPFFFVFDLMFCEYEEYTMCFLCGTNN